MSGPPPERRRPANKWAIALAVAISLAFLYIVRLAVLPFLIAAAIGFAASPAIDWLARHARLSRAWAALIVYLAVMAVVAAGAYVTYAAFAVEVRHIAGDLPQLIERFLHELFGGDTVSLFGHELRVDALAQQAVGGLVALVGQPGKWLMFGLYTFGAITGLTLLIVLIYFFIADGPELFAGVLWLVPPEYRDEVAEVADKIAPMLRRYLVGLFLIFVFAVIATWLFIRFVLHLPFPLLLGLVTGALEMIPVVGPAASATLVGLLSLEQHGLWALAAFAVYVTVFRLAIDRLLGPIILGTAVRLHPVVIMFAMLAGGLVLGVIGVIIAVPVAASVRIVLQHYYAQPTRGQPHRGTTPARPRSPGRRF
jgi:predicted PurR-regulated permease PerM